MCGLFRARFAHFSLTHRSPQFIKNKDVVDAEEIKEMLYLAEFQLESVEVQANHLSMVFTTPGYHTDLTPEEEEEAARKR